MKLLILFILASLLLASGTLPSYSQDMRADSSPTVIPAAVNELVVEINAVRVVLNDEHRQGVDWEAIVSDFHTLQLRKENNPVWADKKYKISIGRVSTEDYTVLLDALDTVGKMEQYPQPGVTMGEHAAQSIRIKFGDSGSSDVRMNLARIQSTKGESKLRLEPLIGQIYKESGTAQNVILKTRIEVLLPDNSTIVIGGIISEQEVPRTHKFPLLGDLPIVGLVFRSRGRLLQRTETMIFLTPRFKAVPAAESKE